MKFTLTKPNAEGTQTLVITHGRQYPYSKTVPALLPAADTVDAADFVGYLRSAIDTDLSKLGKERKAVYNRNKGK